MAKAKLLDVWLTDSNTVYREVPYTVVIDWIQQGRLLEEDQVRPAGSDRWFTLRSSQTLSAYLPRPEPLRVEDQAEALEPVAVDFSWKRPSADEDEDVDMIPLIDISLVLLVFFMMTSTVILSSNFINVPGVQEGSYFAGSGYWIGIERVVGADGRERPPRYSFGEDQKPAPVENQDLSAAEVVERLGKMVQERNVRVDLRIAADRQLPAEVVMRLTAALEKLRPWLREIRAEVSDKQP